MSAGGTVAWWFSFAPRLGMKNKTALNPRFYSLRHSPKCWILLFAEWFIHLHELLLFGVPSIPRLLPACSTEHSFSLLSPTKSRAASLLLKKVEEQLKAAAEKESTQHKLKRIQLPEYYQQSEKCMTHLLIALCQEYCEHFGLARMASGSFSRDPKQSERPNECHGGTVL